MDKVGFAPIPYPFTMSSSRRINLPDLDEGENESFDDNLSLDIVMVSTTQRGSSSDADEGTSWATSIRSKRESSVVTPPPTPNNTTGRPGTVTNTSRVDTALAPGTSINNSNHSSQPNHPSRSGRKISTRSDDLQVPTGFLWKQRWHVGKFVNNPKVEGTILTMVVINALLITLATFSFVYDNKQVTDAFDIIDFIFLTIFTVESAMQLFYNGPRRFIKDKWLVFDLFIVIVSWSFGSVQMFRSLRVVRLLGKIETLKTLLASMVHVAPTLFAILSLLILVIYIFGVIFTMLFKQLDRDGELGLATGYFSRLDHSVFSLVQFITMDWIKSCQELTEHVFWAPVIYVVYLSISGFIVFNLIIAVLCDVLSDWEKDQEELEENERRMEQLNALNDKVNSLKQQMEKTDFILESTMKEILRLKIPNRKKGLFGSR